MNHIYDLIIIGSGPAGLSAGLYAGRARLDTLIIEKGEAGGQIVTTAEVDNYPGGIVEGETGQTLTERMVEQAKRFDAKKVSDTVLETDLRSDIKKIVGENETYYAKTIIIATGAAPNKLHCPGEDAFLGRGVSYCATCDGSFFTDLEVFVVGGGDTAVEEAVFLTRFARKVTLIHRRDSLRAAKVIQDRAFQNEKISFIWDSAVKSVEGEGLLSTILVENLKTHEITEYKADENDGVMGLFVFVGNRPVTELFATQINLEDGYIITDEDMRTNLPGVFAAGDVRKKSLRQVITSAADGAIAAVQAEKYIDGLK